MTSPELNSVAARRFDDQDYARHRCDDLYPRSRAPFDHQRRVTKRSVNKREELSDDAKPSSNSECGEHGAVTDAAEFSTSEPAEKSNDSHGPLLVHSDRSDPPLSARSSEGSSLLKKLSFVKWRKNANVPNIIVESWPDDNTATSSAQHYQQRHHAETISIPPESSISSMRNGNGLQEDSCLVIAQERFNVRNLQMPLLSPQVSDQNLDQPTISPMVSDPSQQRTRLKSSQPSFDQPLVKFLLGDEGHSPPQKRSVGARPNEAAAALKHMKVNGAKDGNKPKSHNLQCQSPILTCGVDDVFALADHDLEEIHSRRWDPRNVRSRRSRSRTSAAHGPIQAFVTKTGSGTGDNNPKRRGSKTVSYCYRIARMFDHTPHEVFVELDELTRQDDEQIWIEKARWIKYEENVEEGSEKWGKPHIASLSFHSLLELRRFIEGGSVLLDLEEEDLPGIVDAITDNMVITDQINDEEKIGLMQVLLLRHRHLSDRREGLRRQTTFRSLSRLISSSSKFSGYNFSCDAAHRPVPASETCESVTAPSLSATMLGQVENGHTSGLSARTPDTARSTAYTESLPESRPDLDLLRRIPRGAEATSVLVGEVKLLQNTAVAFVRLAKAIFLPNVTEIPIPVRFIFIVIGPSSCEMDYHEIGRSLSTLMANKRFQDAAYCAKDRRDLLFAINEFLDDSIVLPPGEWEQRTLLPFEELKKKSKHIRQRRRVVTSRPSDLDALIKEEEIKLLEDPLRRTRKLFGGAIKDVKRRSKFYLSDFYEAFNAANRWNCLSTIVFIFFTCLAPAITFGGLLKTKSGGWLGLKETLVATSFGGILYSLFSAQPLIILGATGPVLVFEESLYRFSSDRGLEFIVFRTWVGIWVFLFSIVTVAFEGSFMVKYVTRFAEDIFSALVSVIFLTECLLFIVHLFRVHPLLTLPLYCEYFLVHENETTLNYSSSASVNTDKNQPNTALMSTCLLLGTFAIAYLMRLFRNSILFGRKVRRALGDFGLASSIIVMTAIDAFATNHNFTDKLPVGDDVDPTLRHSRGWYISPLGNLEPIPHWLPFAAALPGLLMFFILFVEMQITEMMISKREHHLRKGSGYHFDMLLAGALVLLSSLFGLPWLCACSVRTLSHFSSLVNYSTTDPPGQKPHIETVAEQRVTGLIIHLLIGFCLLGHMVLERIPSAVLLGVFLYLGFMNLVGVQMLDRAVLFFVPVKYHPNVIYCLRVRTWRMHLFTVIQLFCFVFVWTVKSIKQTAFAFPFALMVSVLVRCSVLPFLFTDVELHALDGEVEDQEDEMDFYEETRLPV